MVQSDCPFCREWRKKNCRFCANCGKDLTLPSYYHSYHIDNGKGALYYFVLLTITIFLFVGTCALVYCFSNLDRILDAISVLKMYAYIPFGLVTWNIFEIQGVALQIYAVTLLCIELIMFVYAIYRFVSILHETKDLSSERIERSGLTAMSSILAVSLFASVIYILFTLYMGISPDASWLDKYTEEQLAFMFMNAGLMEEITTRVLYIGVPATVISFICYRKRSSIYCILGGFGQTRLTWALILISSLIFGLEHYEEWGWSKVLDAFIGGVLFGYLYTEYGLYASVLAHMVNDTFVLVGYIGFGASIEGFAMLGMVFLGALTVLYWILSGRKPLENEEFGNVPEPPAEGHRGYWRRH